MPFALRPITFVSSRRLPGVAIYPPCYQLVTWVLKGKWQASAYGKIEVVSFLHQHPSMGRNWIKTSLMASGATRLAGKWNGPGVAILMYHSVLGDPQRESLTLGKIIHSSTVFSRHMELIAREYVPISLDELARALTDGKELKPRSVAVTFDDGYSDNCEVAMPILNRVGIPATFYITVDCVEAAKLPWPSRLRHAFYTTRKMSWNDINSSWALQDDAQRDRAFLRACDVCAGLAGDRQEEFVAGVERTLEVGPPANPRRLMMSWDQVRELAGNGHIIGS